LIGGNEKEKEEEDSDVENEVFLFSTNVDEIDKDAYNVVQTDDQMDEGSSSSNTMCEPTTVRKSERKQKFNLNSDYLWGFQAVKVQSEIEEHKTLKSYRQAINSSDKEMWNAAMKREINALTSVHTFNLVERTEGMIVMKGVWNFRIKTKNGLITQYKARYCADGSIETIDNDEKFAPVANIATIQIMIALSSLYGMEIFNGDIPSAYMCANIDDDMEYFLEQPPGYSDGTTKIWKLRRPLYGMKISGRLWNNTITDFLLEIGFKQSSVDPCFFIR